MTIKLKCNKSLRKNARILRQSEIDKMGVSSAEDNIFYHMVDPLTGSPDERSTSFKDDMINTIFYDNYDVERLPRKEVERQLDESIKIGSDIIMSCPKKEETLEEVKMRLEVLSIYNTPSRDKVFMLDYKVDEGVFELLEQHSDAFDILAFRVGCYYYGSPATERLARKIIAARNVTDKPVFLFGVPIKVSGDSQRDVRFFIFYPNIAEAWGKWWGRVNAGNSTPRAIIKDDYHCLTYEKCVSKFGSPSATLPGTDQTVYEFFTHNGNQQYSTYQSILLDEELERLHSIDDPREIQDFMINRLHPDYSASVLGCWKAREAESATNEIFAKVPKWNTPQARGKLRMTIDKVPPGSAIWATRKAFEGLVENIQKQDPSMSFDDFLKEINITLKS